MLIVTAMTIDASRIKITRPLNERPTIAQSRECLTIRVVLLIAGTRSDLGDLRAIKRRPLQLVGDLFRMGRHQEGEISQEVLGPPMLATAGPKIAMRWNVRHLLPAVIVVLNVNRLIRGTTVVTTVGIHLTSQSRIGVTTMMTADHGDAHSPEADPGLEARMAGPVEPPLRRPLMTAAAVVRPLLRWTTSSLAYLIRVKPGG